ncbi:acyl-CoA dehydrogenase [Sphingorhabdus lutea]|uniref:3-methylmercaptopropionyl-CoA dehydrogenase n=1 Tax=Sphingorhabdus lutea TaxID=1913578 RepID=A0A1L3JEN2_9SPHN|nr:acyl-CoA dehydrogenase [Sphingorhabdus lutea]
MSFTAPTQEQLFVLKHIAQIDQLAGHNAFSDASEDMVQAIVEGIGDFAAGEFAPLNRVGDMVGAQMKDGRVVMPQGYRDAYQHYVQNGWGTINAPAEFGGQGLPFTLAMAALDSLGAANMAFTLCPILSVGSIEAILHHGSDAQKEKYLPKLSSGEWTGTMNLTEPQAGSDVGALKSTATPRGDGTYAIAGQKIYISFGDHDMADNIVHLVLARTPDAPEGTRGISLFLVPKYRVNDDGSLGEENGVKTISIEHKMGLNASPTCVLQFGEDGESIGELIGPEFGGMRAMFTMMNNARINVGLQGVQIAEAATQAAISYAQDRVQSARAGAADKSSVTIIQHPDVRRMLMRMKAGTQALRALLYYSASKVDLASLGDEAAKEAVDILTPLAKTYGTDLGSEIASLCVQVHGGMGYIEETGVAQYYRDIRIAAIYEGTNGIQAADLVGRKMGMRGGDALKEHISHIINDAKKDGHDALSRLADACMRVCTSMVENNNIDDRLAGSYAFTTMLSVATAGWLMAQQLEAAKLVQSQEGDSPFLKSKIASAQYYLNVMVGEAMGLEHSALSGAQPLYALSAEEFAA